jgi:hypothetical protein
MEFTFLIKKNFLKSKERNEARGEINYRSDTTSKRTIKITDYKDYATHYKLDE